ncbi:hypothetical protein CRG98_044488 [Punica granatum]|uniref:Uncharacterized protein n=1 Tax=Punica granatum TaxID=22663 RepID=A0A2I0HTU5_PUNGR|nr:hypothetical protein CRG98_044488 [Punica granatum]
MKGDFGRLDSDEKIERKEWSGPPIGNPDPSTGVAGAHRGRRRPRWSGRGRRLAAPTPNRPRTSESESSVDSGSGKPIGDPDTSTEIAGAHIGL